MNRTVDQLQQQYKNQSYSNYLDNRHKQNLYYHLAQVSQAHSQNRKSLQKQIQQKQDNKIKQYWQAQEQTYRQMQRNKKQEVDSIRRTNLNLSSELIQKAKSRDDFQPLHDYSQVYAQQALKQKKQRQQFLKDATEYQTLRKMKQKSEKIIDNQVAQLKLQQRQQQQRKRIQEYRRVKQKHQQNPVTYNQLEQTLKQRHIQQDMLQSYIVNKGAQDQQARLLEMRASFQQKQRAKKQRYINDLKNQLQDETYRHSNEKRIQVSNEKDQIQQRSRFLSEMDRISRLKKQQENRNLLQDLKGQVKPRKLQPDPEVVQKVGLGSPVNIGKVIGDDRKRQLDWIQKSLLRQIHY